MQTNQIEKAAYIAAHRILAANTSAPELACPGARRSHVVDTIADIIKDVFELCDVADHTVMKRHRVAALANFPRRPV